jgi:hypothetical protein
MQDLLVSSLDDIIIGALQFNADFICSDADRASVAAASPVLDIRIMRAGNDRHYRVVGNFGVIEDDGGFSASHDPEVRRVVRRDNRQSAEAMARGAFRAEIATAETLGCQVQIRILS